MNIFNGILSIFIQNSSKRK